MVIDLTAVDYVDSAGLGLLMYTYGTLNGNNGALRLCGVAPRVMSLLQLGPKPIPFFHRPNPRREPRRAAEIEVTQQPNESPGLS